jgi:hypothetical protein
LGFGAYPALLLADAADVVEKAALTPYNSGVLLKKPRRCFLVSGNVFRMRWGRLRG